MSFDLFNLGYGLLVPVSPLQPFSIGRQQGIFVLLLLVLQESAAGRNNWETHQDVRRSQLLSAQVWTTVRGSLQLLLQESEVTLDVASQKRGLNLRSHYTGNRANEEGWRGAHGFESNVSIFAQHLAAAQQYEAQIRMGVEPRGMTYCR